MLLPLTRLLREGRPPTLSNTAGLSLFLFSFDNTPYFFDVLSEVEADVDGVVDSGCVSCGFGSGSGSGGSGYCGGAAGDVDFGAWDDDGGQVVDGIDGGMDGNGCGHLATSGQAVRPAITSFFHKHQTNWNLLFQLLHFPCV